MRYKYINETRRRMRDDTKLYLNHKKTIDYLLKYEEIIKDILDLKREIEHLQFDKCNIKSSLSEINVQQQKDLYDQYIHLEEEIEKYEIYLIKKRENSYHTKWEIEANVNKIKYPLNKVLCRYFLEFRTLERIADEFHFSYDHLTNQGRTGYNKDGILSTVKKGVFVHALEELEKVVTNCE